jgi:drug/metabolite transporter (DMT)-like permease
MEAVVIPSVPAEARKGRFAFFLTLLCVCAFIWSAQPTAVKYVEGKLGPIAITFLPFYMTTVLLVPVLIFKRRANPHAVRPTWADFWKFAMAGVFGQAVTQFCAVWGATLTLASNCSILNLLIPVATAVLASIMLRERLTPFRMICLGLGLAGVMMMSVQDLKHASLFTSNYFKGNMLMLISCTASAFYNVYCKGLLARFQEIEILIFSYITASIASVGALIWLEPDCFTRLVHLDAAGWAGMAFLAFLMYGASMLLLFYVLQFLPVTVASASLYLCPVFGTALAMILLHERPNPWQWVGAAVVLVPTVLIMRYDSSAQ